MKVPREVQHEVIDAVLSGVTYGKMVEDIESSRKREEKEYVFLQN